MIESSRKNIAMFIPKSFIFYSTGFRTVFFVVLPKTKLLTLQVVRLKGFEGSFMLKNYGEKVNLFLSFFQNGCIF